MSTSLDYSVDKIIYIQQRPQRAWCALMLTAVTGDPLARRTLYVTGGADQKGGKRATRASGPVRDPTLRGGSGRDPQLDPGQEPRLPQVGVWIHGELRDHHCNTPVLASPGLQTPQWAP